jgi:lipopolysaccharide export system protein LptC
MHWSRKLIALLAALALCGISVGAKKEQKPSKAAPKKGQSEKQREPASNKMSLPIPKGHDSKGLKIPYFGADRKLQMMFTIGVASRLDEDHVRMSDLLVETFDDAGAKDMVITLPASVLDLNTRVLTSKTNVTIKRSDFEVTGDAMQFDTKTKNGRVEGRVRMLIYNLDE